MRTVTRTRVARDRRSYYVRGVTDTNDRRILVVLQNAYTKGDLEDGYHPATWRRELLTSRSGRRLERALPPARVSYTNSSRVVGDGPESVHEADRAHIRRRLRDVDPDVVLACGKVAETAVTAVWSGAVVVIPHPASRSLTNDLLDQAREHLELRRPGRKALRQLRGRVEVEVLP